MVQVAHVRAATLRAKLGVLPRQDFRTALAAWMTAAPKENGFFPL